LERSATVKRTEPESIEVSFAIFVVDKSKTEEIVQKIGIAINVQLNLEKDQPIPFVPSDQFEEAKISEKLLLSGPSGSGKSRIILEVLRHRLSNLEKIYIINPRNPIGADPSSRASLTDLINRFTPNDAVIWDNFPDDLVRRDIERARTRLLKLSHQRMHWR
jgi:ABC-type multidrug transport system fused ATPase/permease subunit